MKQCSDCGERKPLEEFYKSKMHSLGRASMCKLCNNERGRNNYVKQKGKVLRRQKTWRTHNLPAIAAKQARRRAAIARATPPWLTRDQHCDILRVYEHAQDCGVVSGQRYHVDHIIPLRGKNVCGLHVAWNLQVLPQDINDAKGNR